MSDKGPQAFRSISEVADELDLPQHVLRFWETKFSQIRPTKRSSGRRFYRAEDVELVRAIRDLLYGQGYTIRGVQKLLKEKGARGLATVEPRLIAEEPHEEPAFDESGSEPDLEPRMPVAPPPFAGNILAELHAMRDEVLACVHILQSARTA